MRLPIELIAAVFMVHVFASGSDFGANSPPATAADYFVALAGLLLFVGSTWMVARVSWAVTLRRMTREPARRAEALNRYGRMLTGQRVYSVVAFATFLSCTRWATLVVGPHGMNAAVTVVGDDILQILPFLLASAALWIANYPASRELGPADWSLGEYLRYQVRFTFLILAPWLIMVTLLDSTMYWPAAAVDFLDRHASVELALVALVFAAMLAVFPAYMVRLWPARRLPDGPLRERLEALMRRAKVRCRNLMVWQTGRGRVPNAAVMGVIGRFRYVAFTDALLGEMSPEEVEAVLAHELGHARHGHLWFYVLFTLIFMPVALVAIFLILGPKPPETPAALLMAALVAVYWRYAFGFLSRRFEREADVAACELVGSPLPLMTALEKLALASGSGRRAPSWRHHSVAERVDFAARYGFDREALGGYHRRVRMVKAGLVLATALLIGGTFYLGASAAPKEPKAGTATSAPAAKRR